MYCNKLILFIDPESMIIYRIGWKVNRDNIKNAGWIIARWTWEMLVYKITRGMR